jgi:hypothetical protein
VVREQDRDSFSRAVARRAREGLDQRVRLDLVFDPVESGSERKSSVERAGDGRRVEGPTARQRNDLLPLTQKARAVPDRPAERPDGIQAVSIRSQPHRPPAALRIRDQQHVVAPMHVEAPAGEIPAEAFRLASR